MKKTFVFHFVNEVAITPSQRIFNTVRFVEDFEFVVGGIYTLKVDNETIAFRVTLCDVMCDYNDLKIYFIYGKKED